MKSLTIPNADAEDIDFSSLREDAGPEAHHDVILAIFVAIQSNSSLRSTMVSNGLVASIALALHQPYNKTSAAVCHQVQTIFLLIPGILDEGVEESMIYDVDPGRIASATSFINEGGLEILNGFLRDAATPSFNVYTCLSTIMGLFAVLSESEEDLSLQLAKSILPALVFQMGANGINRNDEAFASSIYDSCIDSFFRCLDAGLHVFEHATIQSLVQSTFSGLLVHRTDEDAQKAGKALAHYLLGPKAALEMIDHAEMHHSEEADCSCAA